MIRASAQQAVDEAGRKASFATYAEQRDNSIIAMEANGFTIGEIAAELDLGRDIVAAVLRKAGRK